MEFKPLENERWVWVKTFEREYPNYLVSDMGRCWSFKSNKFIGNWQKEHWMVSPSNNGKSENIMIGRLMLLSFDIPIPNHLKDLPTSKLQAMHLDGDSTNNNLSNFAWGDSNENTNEENCKRRMSESRKGKHHSEEHKKNISEALKGEKHPMFGRYGEDNPKSKPILQFSKDGEFIREWDSITSAQRELEVKHISCVCLGKRHTAGGYIWKFKNGGC